MVNYEIRIWKEILIPILQNAISTFTEKDSNTTVKQRLEQQDNDVHGQKIIQPNENVKNSSPFTGTN
jgi:hypothetical protein